MGVKKIPRHGETTFAALCAAAGVTCNPSTEDERGWDYLVQFPQKDNSDIPLDMMPAGPSCFVQVKTISGKKHSTGMKLSNGFEFAVSTAPAFVVLFTYTDQGVPAKAYLLHFWEQEISRTLQRVRKLDAAGRRDLNRHKISFSTTAMKECKCEELVVAMLECINAQRPHYSDAKRALLNRVGFDEAFLEGTITFREGVTIEEIVDAQIGLRDTIEIARFVTRSIRFGLPGRPLAIDTPDGIAAMQSNPKPCSVRISSEAAAREASFTGELYAPGLPNLKFEHLRFRVVGPFVQFVLKPANNSLDYKVNFEPDTPQTLDTLALSFNLMHIMAAGRMRITVTHKGQLVGGSCADIPATDITPAIKAMDELVSIVRTNSAPADVPPDFKVSIASLGTTIAQIRKHNQLIMQDEFTGTFSADWADAPYAGPARVLYCAYVDIPGFVVCTLVRRKAEILPPSGGKSSIQFRQVEYRHTRVLNATHDAAVALMDREIAERAAEHADSLVIGLPHSIVG